MCLMEKIHALDKPCPGGSDGAVGREFNVNESTIYMKLGVSEQKHTYSKITN